MTTVAIVGRPSVRPYACLSVMLMYMYCGRMFGGILKVITRFTPIISLGLRSLEPQRRQSSPREHPKIRVE